MNPRGLQKVIGSAVAALALGLVLGVGAQLAHAAPHEYPVGTTLPRREVWKYAEASLDPRSVQSLGEDSVLMASRDGKTIYIVHPTWREAVFTRDDYVRLFGGPTDFDPGFFCAEMQGDRLLVVSRWGRRAFEVEKTGSSWHLNWVYGDGTADYGPNQLFDPFFATYSHSGDALIADDKGQRVLQVRVSDYDASAPDNGFTDASIVWQFGQSGVEGYTGQLLMQPRSIEEMADGTMIVVDTGHRAIRVRKTGARTGEILWTYGTPGTTGDGLGELNDPNRARVLDNGHVLISDGNNARVLEVDPTTPDLVKATVWVYSAADQGSTLVEPRDAVRSSGGLTFMADSGAGQVVAVGYDTSFRVTSASLDCGLPGARKRFNSLAWAGTSASGTGVRLEYSIDGGSWVWAGPANPWMPATAVYGTLIRYRVLLTTTNRAITPVVGSVTIDSDAAPASAVTDPDDGGTPESTSGTTDTTGKSGSSSSTRRNSGSTNTGTGTGGSVSLVPKSGGTPALGGAEFDPDSGVEVFSGTLRGMALAPSGDGPSLGPKIGATNVFSTGGTPGGQPVGAILLLGGLYGGGLVRGALMLRGIAVHARW